MTATLPKRLFTVEDFYKMLESGILNEDDRVELINGEIVEMSPIGSKHAACVKRLNELLKDLLGKSVIISVQDPIRINEFSEPEPDIAIVRRRADFYADSHPEPQDVLLLIEVADSSFPIDRKVKVPLYAEAGIPEVWIVDLIQEKMLVFRLPKGKKYQEEQKLSASDALTIPAASNPSIAVADILG
ncbi:MAG: Uma2 family endonuclease [Saprospiraceae bacterium]|nr:Uma2 family endonuclease [Saprospiraceae bacterium]